MVSSYNIFLFPVVVSCWLPERVRGERREQEDGIREPGYSLASRPRGPRSVYRWHFLFSQGVSSCEESGWCEEHRRMGTALTYIGVVIRVL
jgi:hypothetical protein